MKNLQKMNEEEFKEFLEESMIDCSGIDIGLSCTFEIEEGTYTVDVILTNYMILQDWKNTKPEDFKEFASNFSKEAIDEYEEILYESHTDALRNKTLSLDFGGDDDLEIINKYILYYYTREEENIDFKTLYEARDEIQEEIEEAIEEEF
ncbi:MAG: hypothetical protein KHZ78_07855 [Peptoniphilus sp. oral taxon 375]|nr:hypothetical protein [Peptoniphilus sp. oral taxon 375]